MKRNSLDMNRDEYREESRRFPPVAKPLSILIDSDKPKHESNADLNKFNYLDRISSDYIDAAMNGTAKGGENDRPSRNFAENIHIKSGSTIELIGSPNDTDYKSVKHISKEKNVQAFVGH